MKDKSKVLKTYRDKLQFVYLIGGGRDLTWGRRVPQLGRQTIALLHIIGQRLFYGLII